MNNKCSVIGQINSAAFQFGLYHFLLILAMGVALVIKCITRYCRPRRHPYIILRHIYKLYITNKTERLSLISWCVTRVAKRLKEDWLVVLQ